MHKIPNDLFIQELLDQGRLIVDRETGEVFAPRSNTPDKPLGAATKKGYLRTSVHHDGKSIAFMVHRIVCIAVHGLPAEGQFVNHKNGVKTDNSPSNLEWTTNDENAAHASKNGLLRPPKQDRHYAAKLTKNQVESIRAGSESANVLSKRYGVSPAHIRRIKTNKRWTEGVQVDRRIGKKQAGRLLDGREWNEFPEQVKTTTGE